MKKFNFVLLAAILLAVANCYADPIAFSPNGTIWGNAGTVNLGVFFTVNSPIQLNSLGFYNGDGVTTGETIGLFDSSGNLLTSAYASPADPIVGGYFMHSIAPIYLSAGSSYAVVAFTGNNGWSYSLDSPTINDPRITFDTTKYLFSGTLEFPVNQYPAFYYGPNFSFSSPTHAPEPTSLLLLGTGLGVIGLAAWRRKKI